MNHRSDDPEGSDFEEARTRRGKRNGGINGISSTGIMTAVLGSILIFLTTYFFHDTSDRVRDTSAQLVVMTAKLAEVDLKLVHVQDALDLAQNDRAETKVEIEDLRKQVATLRGMK